MNLAGLISLSKYNCKRYRHIIALRLEYGSKDKTLTSSQISFENLFQNRKPITIQSDNGTAFVNATVQQCLKLRGVNFHTTYKGRCY